jgi:hypothetical protein
VVLIHDAIMYATSAARRSEPPWRPPRCIAGPGGTVAVLPDYVRETFAPATDHGGHDAPDGWGLRYLGWVWNPDFGDETYLVVYALLLRAADGTATVAHDRHEEGLFTRAQWLGGFEEANTPVRNSVDRWGRDSFIGTRR